MIKLYYSWKGSSRILTLFVFLMINEDNNISFTERNGMKTWYVKSSIVLGCILLALICIYMYALCFFIYKARYEFQLTLYCISFLIKKIVLPHSEIQLNFKNFLRFQVCMTSGSFIIPSSYFTRVNITCHILKRVK